MDLDEVPPMTRPQVVELNVEDDKRLVLPLLFFGIELSLVVSPRQPRENEEFLLYNHGYALTTTNSIIPILNHQHMMSGEWRG